MNKSQVIALYDQDQRREIEYPDMRREITPEVVRFIDASENGEGLISYSQLNKTNADDTIREQVRYFESIGQNFEWKLYDYDRPSDLKERLEAHGFASQEAEAILVLDLVDAPDLLWQAVSASVRRITDPKEIADVVAIQRQVWDEEFSSLGQYLAGMLSNHPEQMSVYVAYINEQPASAAWTYFPQRSQFASLWGGSTVRSFRRQGLYTALLAARAQEARSRRVRCLTVDASPMSRPILEKFGFKMIAYSYPLKWKCQPQK